MENSYWENDVEREAGDSDEKLARSVLFELSQLPFQPFDGGAMLFDSVEGAAQPCHPAVERRTMLSQLSAPAIDLALPLRVYRRRMRWPPYSAACRGHGF
jgi:hypothetical protein